MKVIGRVRELQFLKEKLGSKKAEFIAITGRRRIGKTFLVRQLAKDGCFFEAVGEKDADMYTQLANFFEKLKVELKSDFPVKAPDSWREAFSLLTSYIKSQKKTKPVILFFDELPWLATAKSGLLQALDYYWNSEWSKINNLTLIVCGSASSWVRDKLINAKGGLYNRVTGVLHLQPLSLRETNEYFKAKGINFSAHHVFEAYMAVGGVPFYLDQFQKSKSLVQNITNICFVDSGLLYHEYTRLFTSLFGEDSLYVEIIEAIALKRYGVTRAELIKSLKIKSGGYLTKYLSDLEASGFIQKFVPLGKSNKDHVLRVVDEYTIFYLHWIKPFASKSLNKQNKKYWQSAHELPSYGSWAGLAFESLCLKHIDEIVKFLEIDGHVKNISFNWSCKGSKEFSGAQADLIIERTDGVINLCEIKLSQKPFVIDKDYAKNLLNKLEAFKKATSNKSEIHLTIITGNGFKENIWSQEMLHSQIDMQSFLS